MENQEIKKLEDVFLANEYPLKRIQPALETRKSTPPEKETDWLVLPYIKGLSEKITQVCQKLDVPTAFTSQHPHACKTEDRMGVIYKIPCECGDVYIGETGRNLKQRMEEHKRAVRKADPSNAIAGVWSPTGREEGSKKQYTSKKHQELSILTWDDTKPFLDNPSTKHDITNPRTSTFGTIKITFYHGK